VGIKEEVSPWPYFHQKDSQSVLLWQNMQKNLLEKKLKKEEEEE
jgi:hypothetical protein